MTLAECGDICYCYYFCYDMLTECCHEAPGQVIVLGDFLVCAALENCIAMFCVSALFFLCQHVRQCFCHVHRLQT